MTDAKTLTGRVNTQTGREGRTVGGQIVVLAAMWNDRTARRGQSLKGPDVMLKMGLSSVLVVGRWASDTGEDQGGTRAVVLATMRPEREPVGQNATSGR